MTFVYSDCLVVRQGRPRSSRRAGSMPEPPRSTHICTRSLHFGRGRFRHLGSTRNGARGGAEGETQASDSCHLALSCVPEPREGTLSVPSASGPVGSFQGPQAVPSDLLHDGQWPLPVPSSPGTWFCSWVDVACWSLSRRASLSCRAASSSCSRAFSSCSWDMASTILCTMGAAPGDPARLEHLPLPKSRPPMSKVVANQRNSRGATPDEERGPSGQGRPSGMGWECKPRAAAACVSQGLQACPRGSHVRGQLLGHTIAWIRTEESNFHPIPLKACALGLMGCPLSTARPQGITAERDTASGNI